MMWEKGGRMDWDNLGQPCLLVRPLTNRGFKKVLRILYWNTNPCSPQARKNAVTIFSTLGGHIKNWLGPSLQNEVGPWPQWPPPLLPPWVQEHRPYFDSATNNVTVVCHSRYLTLYSKGKWFIYRMSGVLKTWIPFLAFSTIITLTIVLPKYLWWSSVNQKPTQLCHLHWTYLLNWKKMFHSLTLFNWYLYLDINHHWLLTKDLW